MQRNIQQITQQLVDLLPENDQYYRLEELRTWGFPTFIIKRIKIELERNLAESMNIPKTDWANTQSDAVQDAWQQFVDAIHAEVRLPASYGKTVIETAVADVMEIIVQPRRNITGVIFGTEDQLSYEELSERLQAIVVYRHFATLIQRYMQKKGIDELSRERCATIVAEADEKLTSGYSPLNWAQMLEPLFMLADGELDTNLLRLFFEDKNMPRIARKFDLMDDTLTRAEFIEVLSSPDLLDFEGYEDDQSTLFEDQPKQKSAELNTSATENKKETKEEQSEQDAGHRSEDDDNSTETVDEENDTGNTLNGGFEQGKEQATESEEDGPEEENSLNAAFKEPDTEEQETGSNADKPSENEITHEEVSSDEESLQEEKDVKQEDNLPDDRNRKVEGDLQEDEVQEREPVSQKNGQDVDTDEGEATPIWMRYMSEEEIEEYEKRQEQEDQDQQEEQDETEDEGFDEEPIIDLTNEDATDEEIEMLRSQLSGDRDLFVEEIFRGSERAFDQAVEDIAAYDSWRDVSKYIEKDIFKRNLVDMYCEAAVDFTDQLQNYFLEKQNQSKQDH